jgi:pyridoxine 4-dehydrogenase
VNVDEIKKASKFFKVVSVQNNYNIANRKWEAELEYCRDNNIAFIPWYPLSAGNVKAVEKLTSIGKKYDATAAQVALSWLLNHSDNILPIPGTSNVKHLEENYKAADIRLSEEDMSELDTI